jgi:hypothetical protein
VPYLRLSFASHRGGPGSSPVQVMWDLWCTKRRRHRFSSSTSVSPSTHYIDCSTLIIPIYQADSVSRHPKTLKNKICKETFMACFEVLSYWCPRGPTKWRRQLVRTGNVGRVFNPEPSKYKTQYRIVESKVRWRRTRYGRVIMKYKWARKW